MCLVKTKACLVKVENVPTYGTWITLRRKQPPPWILFFPLLWTCAKWQGTTTPLLRQLARDKWPGQEWDGSNWGSHWAPTRVSQSNVSVRTLRSLSHLGLHLSLEVQEFGEPPPLQNPLRPQELRGGSGIPIHVGRSVRQQLEEKAAVMRERKREVCTHVPFVLLTTSPLVFPGYVHTIES